MDKWGYIEEIGKQSTYYIDLLLDMMDKYNKTNLQELLFEEVVEYYENLEQRKSDVFKRFYEIKGE